MSQAHERKRLLKKLSKTKQQTRRLSELQGSEIQSDRPNKEGKL